jgi:site-specific recombinase XerD
MMPTLAVSTYGPSVPVLVTAAGDRARVLFLEFFASADRTPHTRRTYARAAGEFLVWCANAGVPSITAVQPLHVAAWIELQTQKWAAPTVKQQLAAIRHLFDWLFTGQVVPHNPAASVWRPVHSAKKAGHRCSTQRKRGSCSTVSM